MARVFISSTGEDLKEYREAAIDVCNRHQLIPVAMEQFPAMGAGANEGSKRKLDESDVYVGIYAHRYGYIEPGSNVSVTEVEFDHAGERRLERLCFLLDPTFPWPQAYIDFAGHDKLEAFKRKVNTLVRSLFTSVDNFRERLGDALTDWIRRREKRQVAVGDIFEPLFEEYSLFGGRQDILERVQRFIEGASPGYLVITAPAGFGKTALMVRLVSANRDAFAYHFFSSAYSSSGGEDLLSEKFFLRSVVQQMSAWRGRFDRPTESLNELRGEYQNLLVEPLTSTRVLFLDGLDEVQNWRLRPYLTPRVGPGVRVIVSLRDSGQDWASEYGFPADQTQHLPLAGLSHDDIRKVLEVLGGVAPAFGADKNLLDHVAAVAAYPQDPTMGADPFYVRFLAEDIASGDITATNINQQPHNLAAYLDEWFGRIRTSLKDSGVGAELFQLLAVALGPVPRNDLEAIQPALRDPFNGFDAAMPLLRRAVAGNDQLGYAVIHPRLRSYVQKYDLSRYRQKLVEYCSEWRTNRSAYAVGFLVSHLQAARRFEDIYATVLDRTFQVTQRDLLGNIQSTLSDLKLAIEAAADTDDLVHILSCVAEYRRLVQTEGVARGIFEATGQGLFQKALELAAGCEGGQRSSHWLNALYCYLIWEAAEAGDLEAVRRLVAASGRNLRQRGSFAEDLHRALLARAAHSLASRSQISEATWLGEFGMPEGYLRLSAPGDVASTLSELAGRIQELEYQIGDDRASAVEFIDEERAGQYTARLRDQLAAVAALAPGQTYIDRALNVVIDNPYPRYRDTALVALGIAVLAAPAPVWVRERLQRILRCGLDHEGVTFTLDLASQLSAEAARRGLPAPKLGGYLESARHSNDRWGTLVRARSAHASVLYWQGHAPSALAELEQAAASDSGFAGFMSYHLLSLVSRLYEFGLPDLTRAHALMAQAAGHAERVRDPVFRRERLALVSEYCQWFEQLVPAWEDFDDVLAAITNTENRRAYKDLISARWSFPPGARWHDLKRLVPLALSDGTVLDTVLGRLMGTCIHRHLHGTRSLADADLQALIRICEDSFTTSRPWEQAAPAVA